MFERRMNMGERDSFSAAEIEKAFDEETDSFSVLSLGEVGSKLSPFGNSYYTITQSDIEALKCGKILYLRDEYGTTIRYKSTATEEKSEVIE